MAAAEPRTTPVIMVNGFMLDMPRPGATIARRDQSAGMRPVTSFYGTEGATRKTVRRNSSAPRARVYGARAARKTIAAVRHADSRTSL